MQSECKLSRAQHTLRNPEQWFWGGTAACPIFVATSERAASRRRAGLDQLVDDRVHQRLERGIDDVGRDADRHPALAVLVLALDQHAGHRLRAGVEDTHAIVGELEAIDVALVLAEI